ncbi:hypothetical protein [Terriglobus roseus]|uniref:Uncharacterized protein n=1 Tax=Terriglobus roseus TaxID=392734 RepID=A0A1H4K0P2_9BACT|nr:hypothetical protein [Terriglobus roseus]SEB51856.1 hypothetical protein SAMN05443244_0925 [Terriglobus roseus]
MGSTRHDTSKASLGFDIEIAPTEIPEKLFNGNCIFVKLFAPEKKHPLVGERDQNAIGDHFGL